MPCYKPLHGYRSQTVNESGKRGIVFNVTQGFKDMPVELPCGQCIGCRLERSRQWAIRCVHEASLYEKNCFITLTFNDENLPSNGSVDVRDFQLFMKRLRKKFGSGIRFFHCGEYGDEFKRPHYHALIFNFDFPDKVLWSKQNDSLIYTSEVLNELWEHKGFTTIGDVTFESAAYVARYVTKKVTGEKADEHYTSIHRETGEIVSRKPEYISMSRRPGIGKGWFEKYHSEVYVHDGVRINNHFIKPPKFYDKAYEVKYPKKMIIIKKNRELRSLIFTEHTTPERLAVREKLHLLRFDRLKRSYENE
jgi:hypothetical protein